MNALVRKEMRLLFPTWAAAVVAGLLPALLSPWLAEPRIVLLLPASALLAILVALGSFGREFAHGTVATLLAQPVSRARLWWTKVSVLAGALISIHAVWWISFWLCSKAWLTLPQVAEDSNVTPFSTGLFLLAVFSGGLWTMLVFRQVSAAIWFALLLPLALATGTLALLERFAPDTRPGPILACLTLAYGVGGFVLAWRLFLRLEDAEWTGGTISLAGWRRSAARDSATAPVIPAAAHGSNTLRSRRWFSALIKKELHLHQLTLLIGVLVLAMHLGAVAIRHFGLVSRLPTLEAVLSAFWGLWLIMPFLINATAVAEERKLGLHASQLGQPVGWRRQLLVKAGVALISGVILGTVPPCLLEPAQQLPSLFDSRDIGPTWGHWAFLGLLSTFISVAGFYASSMARTTFQALGLGIAVLVAGGLFLGWLERPEILLGAALWRGELGVIIATPVLVLTVVLLVLRNYRCVAPGGREWTFNASLFAAAVLVIGTATGGIYNRSWELLMETDPDHRAPRLPATLTVKLSHQGILSALGSDGHLQVFPVVYRPKPGSWWPWNFRPLTEVWSRHSLGSNWMAAAVSYFDTIAIRSDGTLWASEIPRPSIIRSTDPSMPPPVLLQVGVESGWKDVGRDPTSGRSVLLSKTDGTLWRWNITNRFASVHDTAPTRLGRDADWASAQFAGSRVYLTRHDGRVWSVNPIFRDARRTGTQIDPAVLSARCEAMDGSEWKSLCSPMNFDLGVKADGTLWAMGVLHWKRHGMNEQLDPSNDWQAVAANFNAGIALKKDGSIWKLDFGSWNDRPRLTRLGRQSDWRAVASYHTALYALSADGDIWRWTCLRSNDSWFEMAPSRIPTRVANVVE